DDGAVGGTAAGAAGEIGREDRTRERNVGRTSRERVGDDGRLGPAGKRPSVPSIVAQLEQTGVADGAGKPLCTPRVVEVGHPPRSEPSRHLADGSPELGLLGGISNVHGPNRLCLEGNTHGWIAHW